MLLKQYGNLTKNIKIMIEGVKITKLKQIVDERGKVMHMLRNDSEAFQSFGEIYFSLIYNKHDHGNATMVDNE